MRDLAAGRTLLARYFAISYRVLATPAGREFPQAARGRGAPAIHGYSTEEELIVLVEDRRPSPADVVVDLGSGTGEVAIDLHRGTGCRVVGIDASRRAIAEAGRRTEEAGAAAAVRFEPGDLGTTEVRGSAAYELDSLMFVPQVPDVYAGVVPALGRAAAARMDEALGGTR
jgi:SAM-dependent methyltransferase